MTCSTVRLVVSFHTSVSLSFDLTTSFANFTGMDVKSETSSKDTISSSLAILWQSGNLSEDGTIGYEFPIQILHLFMDYQKFIRWSFVRVTIIMQFWRRHWVAFP